MIFVMGELSFIPTGAVVENPHQPRKTFDEEKLDSLAESIAHLGLLQPILVCKKGDSFELIAGERRLRAAKKAGLATLPAIVEEGDFESAAKALAENLQREELNPLEIAEALKKLMASSTQECLAKQLGLKRSTLANFVRLLSLPRDAQIALREGKISMGHAKALLAIEDIKGQEELLRRIQNKNLSVRQTEKASKDLEKSDFLLQAEEALQEKLGTRVQIHESRVIIDYYGIDDLDRVLNLFGISLC